ncbi:MAG: hypothetical protein QM759_15220 [Terricaulis sp.]
MMSLVCGGVLAIAMTAGAARAQESDGVIHYNESLQEFQQRYPQHSNWSSHDLYQYAYFMMTNATQFLENNRESMTEAEYESLRSGIERARDSALRGCQAMSSGSYSCPPSYPTN